MHRTRTAALLALAVLAAPACARTTTGADAPQAHADPTTAPSTPSAFPPEKIDTLLLSIDEVNSISGRNDLNDEDQLARDTPFADSEQPATATPFTECDALLSILSSVHAFGTQYKTFRFRYAIGTGNFSVHQAVALYPGAQDALKTFDHVKDAISHCGTEFPSYFFNTSAMDSVRWNDPGPMAGSSMGRGCAGAYSVKDNAIIEITVCNFPSRVELTQGFVNAISKKID